MKPCLLFVVALLSIAEVCSAQYTFTKVDCPGATITRLVGLNDHFDMVGNYTMPDGVHHAMLFSKGQFTALDPDGILGTHTSAANQISNRNYPGADFTQVNGVTDNDTVIGHFRGSDTH